MPALSLSVMLPPSSPMALAGMPIPSASRSSACTVYSNDSVLTAERAAEENVACLARLPTVTCTRGAPATVTGLSKTTLTAMVSPSS